MDFVKVQEEPAVYINPQQINIVMIFDDEIVISYDITNHRNNWHIKKNSKLLRQEFFKQFKL